MRRLNSPIVLAVAAFFTAPLAAQLALPQLPAVPATGGAVGEVLGQAGRFAQDTAAQTVETLRLARLDRIATMLRRNRATVERDLDGLPARRGVLLVIDPGEEALGLLAALGFRMRSREVLDEIGITVAELTIPAGVDLPAAQKLAAREVPDLVVASDALHFQSGLPGRPATAGAGTGRAAITVPLGLIDGAPAQKVTALRGFAAGAPTPSNHGSAVAALAASAGVQTILVADVYGTDPAGGNALAIARGMNWVVARGARVISISLVGPRNSVLQRAIEGVQAKNIAVVAAVGNDGPAAPPSFPASYDGVLAVTAVDKRNRPLIEAGRALHLDYAAPGADIAALNAAGRPAPVRGTSFAAPLAAARAAAAIQRGASKATLTAMLDAEARPLGSKRPDPRSGRGLLCESCR